jgi:hypothetical protein
MALKSLFRYCPECSARYNVLLAESAEFNCIGCGKALRLESILSARLVAVFCAFLLPALLYVVEPTWLWLLFGASLGALLYINMVSLLLPNPSHQRDPSGKAARAP